MSIRTLTVAFACTLLLAVAPSARAQADVEGSRDHPLVSRMPGYVIDGYKVEEFGAFDPTVIGGQEVHWEGQKFSLSYKQKEGAKRFSTLQIVRNYEAAIRRIGGTVLGGDDRRTATEIRKNGALTGVYIECFNDGASYEVTIVESASMRQDVTADAAAMGKELAASGRTIVHGLYFDTGSAVIQPKSEAALAQMVKLLTGSPALKTYVIGHTDNVGALAANLKLSAERADALVKALVKRGIAAGRLKAAGVGPYSPVASNADEAGRALNRRVELVAQ